MCPGLVSEHLTQLQRACLASLRPVISIVMFTVLFPMHLGGFRFWRCCPRSYRGRLQEKAWWAARHQAPWERFVLPEAVLGRYSVVHGTGCLWGSEGTEWQVVGCIAGHAPRVGLWC